jgi:hypothetical protein
MRFNKPKFNNSLAEPTFALRLGMLLASLPILKEAKTSDESFAYDMERPNLAGI